MLLFIHTSWALNHLGNTFLNFDLGTFAMRKRISLINTVVNPDYAPSCSFSVPIIHTDVNQGTSYVAGGSMIWFHYNAYVFCWKIQSVWYREHGTGGSEHYKVKLGAVSLRQSFVYLDSCQDNAVIGLSIKSTLIELNLTGVHSTELNFLIIWKNTI